MSKQDQTNWMEKLPDIDRQTIETLVGGNLNNLVEPREMIFVLCDIQDEKLNEITEKLVEQLFEVFSSKDPEVQGLNIIEAKKSKYVINEDNYLSDKKFFTNVASEYKIHYDGWFASN